MLPDCNDLSDLISSDPEAVLTRSVCSEVESSCDARPREDRIREAATEFQARRTRQANPNGSFDRHGRWYPKDSEKCPICSEIRNPSKRWPYTLLLHCRTATHVAARAGLQPLEVKRAARAMAR